MQLVQLIQCLTDFVEAELGVRKKGRIVQKQTAVSLANWVMPFKYVTYEVNHTADISNTMHTIANFAIVNSLVVGTLARILFSIHAQFCTPLIKHQCRVHCHLYALFSRLQKTILRSLQDMIKLYVFACAPARAR